MVQFPLWFLAAGEDVIYRNIEEVRILAEQLNRRGGLPVFIAVEAGLGDAQKLCQLCLGQGKTVAQGAQSVTDLFHATHILSPIL